MTRTEAAALEKQWSQRVNPPPCDHLDQELESVHGVYLTGHSFCKTCGQLIPHHS